MADEQRPRSVKDVPAELFIKAFAAHLKQSNKVRRPGEGPGGRSIMLRLGESWGDVGGLRRAYALQYGYTRSSSASCGLCSPHGDSAIGRREVQ